MSHGTAAVERQGKDHYSNGRRMFEGFHDWAIPVGREKLGGINSAFKEGLVFV